MSIANELQWEPIRDDRRSFVAKRGAIRVGMIVELTDGSGWTYSVDNISLRHWVKMRGTVKSERSARAAIQRAWDFFIDAAGLHPPTPKR